jgi:hypothetical protein
LFTLWYFARTLAGWADCSKEHARTLAGRTFYGLRGNPHHLLIDINIQGKKTGGVR